MNKKLLVSSVLIAVAVVSLSGCAAGGLMGDKSEVNIDPANVDSEFRQFFPTVNKIALVSALPVTPYIAEHMETNSSLEVLVFPPPEGSSPSQGRSYMEEVCAKRESPEAVLLFRQPTTKTNSGGMMLGAVIGRTIQEYDVNTETLNCATSARSEFLATGKVNGGYADMTRIEQILGYKFSEALLGLAGKPVM